MPVQTRSAIRPSLKLACVCIAVAGASALAAQPNSVDRARARLDADEQDRAAALSEQQTASQKAAAAAADAARLAAERISAEARLRDAQLATEAAGAKMQALEQARRDAEARVASRAQALQPLLPVLERLSRYPAETMLAVSLPPADAIRGVTVLHAIASEIAQQAASLRQEQTSLQTATDQLAAAAPALNAAETAQAAAAADLARGIALAETAQREADLEAAAAGRRAARLTAEAASLRALLEKLQADETRQEKRALREKATLSVPLHGPTRLLTPVSGTVVRHFGDPTEAGPAVGVSYKTPPGAQVVAPCGGRVMFAAPFRSYGRLLILDCGGGTDLVLAGFERFDVKTGQSLEPGAPVGEMPGNAPVLYFELRRSGEPADPSSWLKTTS